MNDSKKALYRARRASVASKIGDAIFVFQGASLVTRNSDIAYPFRQESNFLYLTGWTHPDAFLIIEGGKHPRSTIFFEPQKDRERLWNGKTPTHREAVRDYGFDCARSIAQELPLALSHLTQTKSVVYRHPRLPVTSSGICLNLHIKKEARDGSSILSALRIIKDKSEIATMRKAARISGCAHRDLMRSTHPGMREYELTALFAYRASHAGADPQNAYPSIVAAGENACTLHYTKCSAKIRDGDLVLVDAGCEVEGYASDITRTFPANGIFTEAQRVLYEIVLRAQKQAIKTAKIGRTIGDVHQTAVRTIAEGLIRHKLINDPDVESAITSKSVNRFFPHGTNHWLGLDVHDVGEYEKDSSGIAQRKLLAGMVITVEPGIYIPKNMRGVETRFHGIGIRIEDDVLITESGNEILSRSAPKEIDEIEGVMGRACF